jgi:DNA-binding CsgD family transcriptional regulator
VFDVSREPNRIGLVQSVRFLDAAPQKARVGRRVAELLEELGCTPAEPAVRGALENSTPHLTEALLPEVGQPFRVVTTHVIDRATLRVTVRCLDSLLLQDLIDAKVARVAEAHGLSGREQQVLHLLLRGRGAEEIATMLEIAPRTVKFHQANVLRKLDAQSRLDLLRVIL